MGYWSKIADLTYSACIFAPIGGELSPFEFRQDLWHQKTRIPALSYSIVSVMYVQPL